MKKRQRIFACLLTGSLLMGLNTGVQAEENNAVLPDYTLEETVVTAKKTDEKLLSVPGSVDVVTAKDIQEHNYQSVSEALQSLPGVFVFPSSDMSMGNGIQIRGNSGNGIKIMVDGMPMNDGFGDDNAWDTIPMNNIAKIQDRSSQRSRSIHSGQRRRGKNLHQGRHFGTGADVRRYQQ